MTAKDVCPKCNGTGMGQFNHNRNASCEACEDPGKAPKREKIARIIGEDYHDDRDWDEYTKEA